MSIGYHPELIVLHVLNKELENVFDCNIVLTLGPRGVGKFDENTYVLEV